MSNGHGGRREGAGAKPVLDLDQRAQLLEMYSKGISASSIADHFNVHRVTVLRYIKRAGL